MRLVFIFAFAGLAALSPITFQEQNQEQQKQEGKQESQKQDKKKIEIPSDGPEAVARRDFMRTKLMYSKNVFEGLTTGDFDLVQEGLKELRTVTEGGKWVRIDDPRYRKLEQDFKTTLDRLGEAAESENIDATALRYYQMSTSCIDCHKHIRKADYF